MTRMIQYALIKLWLHSISLWLHSMKVMYSEQETFRVQSYYKKVKCGKI